MSQAYPLQWPQGVPRSKSFKNARFEPRPIAICTEEILKELRCLRAKYIVISSNLELRNDGLPRSSQRQPEDKGVAVYFQLDERSTVIACDQWDTIDANMRAVFLTIQAMRGIDRWGCTDFLRKAFSGFEALPPPCSFEKRHWSLVLGIDVKSNPEQIKKAYREAALKAHPDNGGSHEAMSAVNAAYEDAKEHLAAKGMT